MIEIGMNEIHKNFGFKAVLSGLNLEAMTKERIGIVGRNGTGKSTILKIITGEENADSGTVSIRKSATLGYLEQIPTLTDSDKTAGDILRSVFASVFETEDKMRLTETKMAEEADSDALNTLMENYQLLQIKFLAMDGYSVEERLNRVIQGFSLEPLLERPFNVLSGGQKTLIGLACTVLKEPDILLLDEPTNHLDMKTLEWFEDYLSRYNGTVLIVSHDRYFLDKVTNKTVILDAGQATMYHGNYSFSVEEQERELLIEFEHFKVQQKKIEAMKAAIKRFREWGARADNPKFFRKAKELEKRLEKMELIDRPQLEKKLIPLEFSSDRSSRDVLTAKDFSFSFGKLQLFDGTELLIQEKEKACLMGDNGTGKTTFIHAVLGLLDGYSGMVKLAPKAKIGYIPQEIRFENPKQTVLEYFRMECPMPENQARSILSRYFFYGENVFKRVSSLSGGEKVLLKLAVLVQREVNFLVLDEPTNHIDIETREMLEEALSEFNATILFISHDRYFIRKIGNRMLEIKNKKIESFYGDYDTYRAYKANRSAM